MAAYPMTNVSKTSIPTPDAGIQTERADDGTLKFRRDKAVVDYVIPVLHSYITQAELTAILAFVAANGYGPHTFTLHDVAYIGTLLNEPTPISHEGLLHNVESVFQAVKV